MKITPIKIAGLILLLVSGCSVNGQQGIGNTSTIPEETKIISPPIVATATFLPEIVTPPQTPSHEIIPTLTHNERENYLWEYFRNKKECKFPCFLGVIPGTTTFSQFQANMRPLGIKNSPIDVSSKKAQEITLGGLDFDSKQVLNRVNLIVEPGGIISEIEGILHAYINPIGFSEAWDILDIKQLLLSYGEPSLITINTDYNDVEGRVGYSIDVYYLEQGFAVYYNGGADYEDTVKICPHLSDYQLITIGFTLQLPPFEKQENAYSTKNFYTELDTGLSTKELYTLFSDSSISCLLVPSNKFK